ncbi:MAG: sulfatase-like hydrolase/transferase, partial [Planctomycetes bacterium]|nr:sulfatase-like hydrolase/transferase [Planctomycetota bacterium]
MSSTRPPKKSSPASTKCGSRAPQSQRRITLQKRPKRNRGLSLPLPLCAPSPSSSRSHSLSLQAPSPIADGEVPLDGYRRAVDDQTLIVSACHAYYQTGFKQDLDAIGEILGLLEEYDLTDNTLVIFASDNGAGPTWRNAPLRGGKSR